MKLHGKFVYNRALSIGRKDCENVLIKGDNKLVLPFFKETYAGRIKCIYIDPPYNNGDDYHYYTDKAASESWLSELETVLRHLRDLLCDQGSLWISIDDAEMAYLKVAADKIFGRRNFAGTIIWRHRKTRENRALFSHNHEYILVYAKDIVKFKEIRKKLPVDDAFVAAKYKNPDNDLRGPWQSVSASVQAGHGVPSQFYTIISPAGKRFDPPKGRCWIYNEARMKREIAGNNVWFGKKGCNAPRIKKFLKDARLGLTPETLWADDECGTTDGAKKHLLALFPAVKHVFETPKPEELVKRIVEISTDEGDYVLDCFVGSGSTLSAAHKLHRRYIGIEIGDQMGNLVAHRMAAVINGEQGGISSKIGWHGGGNFSFYDFKNEEARSGLKCKLTKEERAFLESMV